jgi:beta-lactamase regulating signal transducer with metallopeptidase domain
MMTDIFLVFLGISLSAGLVVSVLLLFSPFFNRRYASKWTYWIWLFLAFRLILPLGGSSLEDIVPKAGTSAVSGSEQGDGGAVEKAGMNNPAGQTAPWRQFIVEIPAQLTAPISGGFPDSRFSATWLDAAAFIWMLGSTAFLAVHLASYLYYKKQITKKGKRVQDTEILCRIEELKRELRIKGTVDAVEFPEAASPMLTGFFKPVLVLPTERYTPAELYFILKHELVHCKRRDVSAKLLFTAANAVHWFNPLIWMMRRRAAVDMELSCDERVVQGADYAARKAYTETLLSTLRKNTVKRTVLSTQFYGGAEIMKKRFQNILNRGGRKNGAMLFTAAALLTVILGTLTGYSVSRVKADNLPGKEGDGVIPAQGRLYGYISGFDGETVTIDRQFWVTDGDADWRPEYNDAAGFEVVDAQETDITYPLSEDCAYSILENHHTPVVELDKKGFEDCLSEMEYPVLWILQVQDGQVTDISEQYVP